MLQVTRRAHRIIGDQMRQMGGHRQHQIVMGGIHDIDRGAQPLPEFLDACHRRGVCAFDRRKDRPALVEQAGEA